MPVGGISAIYFKKHGIQTEFLYTKDHGGLHIMEDVATVYLTKDKHEIVEIIQKNAYDAIIVVDTASAYKWIKKANYKGPVLIEARTPEMIKLQPHITSFNGLDPLSIIVPSHYQKRVVSILTDGIPIHVIYNGIDTSFYRALPKEDIHFHHDPLLPKEKKVIGWIGRLDRRKNWPMLIEIAKRIKSERDDVEFWIIGGAQSVQREEFAAVWHDEQLTDIIKWFPVIPYQEMPHIYSKIRESGGCTLATTKTESFGNTFIESMVSGVPVVAANMMPMTELVIQGETGLLYRDQSVQEAIEQLYKIIDNAEFQQEMSQQAIKHVHQHFAIEIVAQQYIDLINKLVQPNLPNKNEVSEQ